MQPTLKAYHKESSVVTSFAIEKFSVTSFKENLVEFPASNFFGTDEIW